MHEKVEAGWPKAYQKAKSKNYSLGMTSISGPAEAWFLQPQDSFAAIESSNQEMEKNAAFQAEIESLGQQDKNLISGSRTIIARYNARLSYRPNENMAQMRYFWIEAFRIRPGHYAEFAQDRSLINSVHAKADIDEHWAVYDVEAGMPSGTVLVFHALKSLKEVDEYPSKHGAKYAEAMGAENGKKMNELRTAYTLSMESNYYALNPKMSYVSKEFAGADMDFWMPKPKVAAKPAAAPNKPAATGVSN